MYHYADDLATGVDALALKDISMFGFSTGGGEVARYVARHGTSRVAKLRLISAVTPIMLRTPDHPAGVPIEVFDGIRADMVADRSKVFRDLPHGPFFAFNTHRAGVKPSMVSFRWLQEMLGGCK